MSEKKSALTPFLLLCHCLECKWVQKPHESTPICPQCGGDLGEVRGRWRYLFKTSDLNGSDVTYVEFFPRETAVATLRQLHTKDDPPPPPPVQDDESYKRDYDPNVSAGAPCSCTLEEKDARDTAKHPDQPLYRDAGGVIRFKSNAIVRTLLHGGPYDMNKLGAIDFTVEDQAQFAQLIGYSLDEWADLSYVSDEAYDRASAQAVHDK